MQSRFKLLIVTLILSFTTVTLDLVDNHNDDLNDYDQYKYDHDDDETHQYYEYEDPDVNLVKTGQSIVDKFIYDAGESFNITCDVSTFSGLPASDFLQSIALLRQTSEKEYYVIAQHQPFIPEPYTNIIDLPDQWTVRFSGEKSSTNRNLMRLIVTVQNFQFADAGQYKCRATLPDATQFNNTAVHIIVESHSIVDKFIYEVGESFNITCDVSKFSGLPASDYLQSIALLRQTSLREFYVIAQHQPFRAEPNTHKIDLPYRWIALFRGDKSATNRYSMRIVVTVKNFQFADAGEYKCGATVTDSTQFYSTAVKIIAESQSIVDKFFYDVGESFNITCDVSKFSGLPASDFLQSIALLRQTSQKEFYVIAQHQLFRAERNTHKIKLPDRWLADCSWQLSANNGYKMRIMVTVQNFQFADAGQYKCRATLRDLTQFNSTAVNIMAKGLSIVDKFIYYVGESFNITCDVSKFSGLPASNYVQSIALLRQTSLREYYVIAQHLPFIPEPDTNIIDLPDHWTVQFSGEMSVTNRNSMRIVVTVQNFQFADAGQYKCRTTLPDATQLYSTAVHIMAKSLSIVDKFIYYVGESFNITCDVSKFSGLPASNYLKSIALLRQTSQKEFYVIAQHQPFRAEPNTHKIDLPEQWTVRFSGDKSATNRYSMRIVVTVKNFQFADAGQYKCRATLRDSSQFNSTAVNLMAENKPKNMFSFQLQASEATKR
ncbi:uncharacterized protein LOC129922803 isoform X3 [Biomphalaria glabrata]|uniref:Uncharacterized protein LOC129922803 isoform X3 n=1 Tax=Biomphalaria glabrata TaxID=6526 RepID=A0A9W2YTK0_BIOGL|nr:uncharacterized protein LOC129922803 isoform X3 [Biomphalaria glabrata]